MVQVGTMGRVMLSDLLWYRVCSCSGCASVFVQKLGNLGLACEQGSSCRQWAVLSMGRWKLNRLSCLGFSPGTLSSVVDATNGLFQRAGLVIPWGTWLARGVPWCVGMEGLAGLLQLWELRTLSRPSCFLRRWRPPGPSCIWRASQQCLAMLVGCQVLREPHAAPVKCRGNRTRRMYGCSACGAAAAVCPAESI